MAAFFKVPASAGIVVCAEHVFASRSAPVGAGLTCGWTRDAGGGLIRAWREEPAAAAGEAVEPLTFATAA
jgi:hypothetical protein